MPRYPRRKCETGIYHIMARGINRQDIFYDHQDYQRYLNTIARLKENRFDLYAYCLMSNHVHLLVHEKEEDISIIMKRIGTSFAKWHNNKYDRVGHVFQGRYRSEGVEDDLYLLGVTRYIHQNPVAAGITKKVEEYRWSSCRAYYGLSENPEGLTDTAFILDIFDRNEEKSRESFIEFMEEENEECYLEDEIVAKKSDDELQVEIIRILNGEPISVFKTMEKKQRDPILREIKNIEGVTLRQIARVIGINRNIIFRA